MHLSTVTMANGLQNGGPSRPGPLDPRPGPGSGPGRALQITQAANKYLGPPFGTLYEKSSRCL